MLKSSVSDGSQSFVTNSAFLKIQPKCNRGLSGLSIVFKARGKDSLILLASAAVQNEGDAFVLIDFTRFQTETIDKNVKGYRIESHSVIKNQSWAAKRSAGLSQ